MGKVSKQIIHSHSCGHVEQIDFVGFTKEDLIIVEHVNRYIPCAKCDPRNGWHPLWLTWREKLPPIKSIG